jgi:hypothetical protein
MMKGKFLLLGELNAINRSQLETGIVSLLVVAQS